VSTLVIVIVAVGCILAVLAALAYLGWKVSRAVRTGLRVSRTNRAAVDRISRDAAEASAKADALSRNGAVAASAVEHLRVALARLSVSTGALVEAQEPLAKLRAVFTKK
jgi:hypothetical protein